MSASALTLRFLERELRNRFSGSFSGGLWALIQPLIQLAVYAFVFVRIFKARVPGADAPGYVAFLVAALWPWTAFSESLMRATTAIQENAALIGKVALPREILIVASVASSFAIHLVGFVSILLVLALTGHDVRITGIAPAIALFAPLFALALGIALILSSIQVFVRDLVQALGQLLTLLMFAAPIFYDRELLPEHLRRWLDLNPFTFYADAFRAALLGHGSITLARIGVAVAISGMVLAVGHRIFRRLDPHFEDFL